MAGRAPAAPVPVTRDPKPKEATMPDSARRRGIGGLLDRLYDAGGVLAALCLAALLLVIVAQMVAHDAQALARGKRLLDRAVGASARANFGRERRAQLRILARMDRSGLPGRSSQASSPPAPSSSRGAAR